MKKVSLLLSFVLSSVFVFGQSVTLTPTTMSQQGGGSDNINIRNASSGNPNIAGIKHNGSIASPTATSSGNILMRFSGAGYGTSLTGERALMDFYADENWTGSSQGTRITFSTTASGTTAPSERMRIDNTGFVGIGTANPLKKLHVFSGSSGVGSFVSSSNLLIEDDVSHYIQMGAPNAEETGVLFGKPSSSASGGIIYDGSNRLQLRTGGNVTRMTVTSAGNVGIGTTSPDRVFEVSSSGTPYIRVSDISGGSDVGLELFRVGAGSRDWRVANSAGDIDFRVSSDDFGTTTLEYQMTPAGFLPGIDNVNDLGSASFRWDDVFATNGVIQTSDRREKENIKSLNYGLKDVMKLTPVRYTWKSNPEKGQKVGLIAQEVATIIPEVVNGLKSDGSVGEQRLGMSYAELVPVLINAIKEQQQIIDQLNQNMSALSSEVASMKKQFDVNSDKVKAVTTATDK